jgi:hypothetical protein
MTAYLPYAARIIKRIFTTKLVSERYRRNDIAFSSMQILPRHTDKTAFLERQPSIIGAQ